MVFAGPVTNNDFCITNMDVHLTLVQQMMHTIMLGLGEAIHVSDVFTDDPGKINRLLIEASACKISYSLLNTCYIIIMCTHKHIHTPHTSTYTHSNEHMLQHVTLCYNMRTQYKRLQM